MRVPWGKFEAPIVRMMTISVSGLGSIHIRLIYYRRGEYIMIIKGGKYN